MKRCIKCGVTKSEDSFFKNYKMKFGRLNSCKECFSKYTKKRDRKLKRLYGIGRRTIDLLGLKLSLLIYDRANRKCEFCKSEYDLLIHHKNGKGRTLQNKKLPMDNRPSNLRVLCRSCHSKLHAIEQWKRQRKE